MTKKKFVLFYYGTPDFKDQAECDDYKAKWMSWVKTFEASIVDGGCPVRPAKTVSSGNATKPSENKVSGYSVAEFNDIEEAVKTAEKCPHLAYGTVDVAEAMDMKMC